MTLIGPAASAEPSATAMGLANATIAAATIVLDRIHTVATVGARLVNIKVGSYQASGNAEHAETRYNSVDGQCHRENAEVVRGENMRYNSYQKQIG